MDDFKVWSNLLNPTDFGLPAWVTTVRPLSHLAPDCVTFVREGVPEPEPGFRVHVVGEGDIFNTLAGGAFGHPSPLVIAIPHDDVKIGNPFKTFNLLNGHRDLWPSRGGVLFEYGVSVGLNTVIDRGIYGEHTQICEDTHIDNLVHIAHSCRIAPRCTIVAGTVLGGWTVLEENVWMGINSSTLPHVRVGHDAYVGAGAVCTRDVPPYAVMAGVPARILKWRCPCGNEIEFARLRGSCKCGKMYLLEEPADRLRDYNDLNPVTWEGVRCHAV